MNVGAERCYEVSESTIFANEIWVFTDGDSEPAGDYEGGLYEL